MDSEGGGEEVCVKAVGSAKTEARAPESAAMANDRDRKGKN